MVDIVCLTCDMWCAVCC